MGSRYILVLICVLKSIKNRDFIANIYYSSEIVLRDANL